MQILSSKRAVAATKCAVFQRELDELHDRTTALREDVWSHVDDDDELPDVGYYVGELAELVKLAEGVRFPRGTEAQNYMGVARRHLEKAHQIVSGEDGAQEHFPVLTSLTHALRWLEVTDNCVRDAEVL